MLARLLEAPAGTKGISLFLISLFLVPKFLPGADGTVGKRNDVHCVSIEHKLGIHASPTCTMMNHARLNVGLQGVGIAEAAYQHALDYARQRVQ